MAKLNRRDFLKISGVAIGGAALAPGVAHAAAAEKDPDQFIGMLYDATKCIGCNACTNACRQWNHTRPEMDDRQVYDAPKELSADTWTMIQLYKEKDEFSFVKRQCMHCVDPACVSGCPVQALQKTAAGPVTYDSSRCIGCRYCMYTCPFHVPRFQWQEKIPVVAKCTLCSDRIAAGNGPACAERCPTGALIWGKRGDLLAAAHQRLAENPGKYVDQIYGEKDAGGTGVMYISAVPFPKLGLPVLEPDPVPKLSEDTANVVLPGIIIGGPIVLAAIRFASRHGAWEETWPL